MSSTNQSIGSRTSSVYGNSDAVSPAAGGLIVVATPTDANAATAGVPVGGLYRDNADPAVVYVRKA